MTRAPGGATMQCMNTPRSQHIQKYVLVPMPRTDARPRRFRLAPADLVTRIPSVMDGPQRARPGG
jgi:hypothetical protein